MAFENSIRTKPTNLILSNEFYHEVNNLNKARAIYFCVSTKNSTLAPTSLFQKAFDKTGNILTVL